MKHLARFIFEAGMLKKIRRSGYPFLGSGGESIADHSFRAALLGYQLALLQPDMDASRVALMLLCHDLPEARTGDLNYVNKRYAQADAAQAWQDQAADLPPQVAASYLSLIEEFESLQTRESLLAHDADQLDMIVELKEQHDLGNIYAQVWIKNALPRLHTTAGKEFASAILATGWAEWWLEKEQNSMGGPNEA
jgi:putative hydrolase of HD superfamily